MTLLPSMRQLGPGSYGVRAWISVDGVGLASARGSYGLQRATAISPASSGLPRCETTSVTMAQAVTTVFLSSRLCHPVVRGAMFVGVSDAVECVFCAELRPVWLVSMSHSNLVRVIFFFS